MVFSGQFFLQEGDDFQGIVIALLVVQQEVCEDVVFVVGVCFEGKTRGESIHRVQCFQGNQGAAAFFADAVILGVVETDIQVFLCGRIGDEVFCFVEARCPIAFNGAEIEGMGV